MEGLTPSRLLPRVYGTFFGRFARLTGIQARSIAPILEGRDVLLCSPTASGKTEAYAGPLSERQLGSERRPMSVLIVSPTRALANDLKRRLEARMDTLQIAFGRYTGEHKERSEGRLPEVAVTTPEALDSLCARHADWLRALRSIVLDEIHVLDGTPRGDQLRCLLHRLRGFAAHPFQRLAVSATVASPDELASRYLEDAVIVVQEGRRNLRAKAFPGTSPAAMARHLDELAKAGIRKVLAFCNRRKDVETYAASLRGKTRFGDSVFAHHGSLARSVRERVERQFLESAAAVAFATLTLELGIDIGSVDYVLLTSPPHGIDSLLQRVGRGNRRTGETRVGYAHATEAQRRLLRTMLRHAARGELLADPYAFRPGVLVQQALVLAGGRGYTTAAALTRAIPTSLRSGLPEGTSTAILSRMVEQQLVEPPLSRRYVLSDRQDRAYDRGVLHSNFDSPPDVEVVDRLTGEVIGHLATTDGQRSVRMGGSGRKVVHRRPARVLTDSEPNGQSPTFTARGYPVMSFSLGRAFARDLGCEADEVLQRRLGDSWLLLHGLGSVGGAVLLNLLDPAVVQRKGTRISPMLIVLAKPLSDLPSPDCGRLDGLLARHEKLLATLANMGRFHGRLPPEVRRPAVREAANLDGIAEFLASARLRTVEHPEAPSFWGDL